MAPIGALRTVVAMPEATADRARLDPRTERFLADPHTVYDELRPAGGLVPDHIGWSTISYAASDAAFRDPALDPRHRPAARAARHRRPLGRARPHPHQRRGRRPPAPAPGGEPVVHRAPHRGAARAHPGPGGRVPRPPPRRARRDGRPRRRGARSAVLLDDRRARGRRRAARRLVEAPHQRVHRRALDGRAGAPGEGGDGRRTPPPCSPRSGATRATTSPPCWPGPRTPATCSPPTSGRCSRSC